MSGGKPSEVTLRSFCLTGRNEVGHSGLGHTMSDSMEEGKQDLFEQGRCLVCLRDKT